MYKEKRNSLGGEEETVHKAVSATQLFGLNM